MCCIATRTKPNVLCSWITHDEQDLVFKYKCISTLGALNTSVNLHRWYVYPEFFKIFKFLFFASKIDVFLVLVAGTSTYDESPMRNHFFSRCDFKTYFINKINFTILYITSEFLKFWARDSLFMILSSQFLVRGPNVTCLRVQWNFPKHRFAVDVETHIPNIPCIFELIYFKVNEKFHQVILLLYSGDMVLILTSRPTLCLFLTHGFF